MATAFQTVALASVPLALLAGARGQAFAQNADAQAQAEASFREGRDLLAKGDFAAACRAFDASYSLDATLQTLLNRANCREQNHELATAWSLFIEAERQSSAATDEATQQLHQVALDHSQQLAPRVSKLTISVSADSKLDRLEILRDKDRVDPAVWNVALPIDGGTYAITARAPGSTEWTTSVTIGSEADTKTVDVPKLQILAPQPPPKPAAPEAPDVGGGPSETTDAGHGQKMTGIALGGVAVGALVTGVVFARLSSAAYDDINSAAKANKPFDPTKQSSAHTDTTVAGVMFGLAGAAAIAGGVLYYLGVRAGQAEPTVAIAPLVAPAAGGATVSVHF
jgi:serine/threonine-protein kinase